MKHDLDAFVALGLHDAPHTGARLETEVGGHRFFAERRMPPTRGHDLKPVRVSLKRRINMMPPTRGHDLKP